MGIFSKPEVVIMKESSDAKDYLQKLQNLLPKASGDIAEKIKKEITIVNAGIVGEDNIMFELKNSGMDMVVLHDIFIKTTTGLAAQIDYLVLTPKYHYVIECKNLFGNIDINNNGDFVRTIQYGSKKYKEGIYSPITQNERHLNVLKEWRLEDKNVLFRLVDNTILKNQFKGIVVLANPKTVVYDKFAKKEIKEKVIRADQLINYIKETNKQCKDLPLTLKELKGIGESYIKSASNERPDYYEKYEELVGEISHSDPSLVESTTQESSKTHDDDVMICPRCGAPLVLRTAKKGDNAGNQFYGCSRFPKCRYIQNT